MKIRQILDKIDENQLFIPAFQREYVWKRENAKELITALIREYPTGTMLTWETNHPPELKWNWIYNPLQGAIKIILDGQQRITTLYMLIRGQIPPYYQEKDIDHDPRELYVKIDTLELQYYKQNLMQNDPYWINITDILQRKVQIRHLIRKLSEIGELSDAEENTIENNLRSVEKIPDLEFVEQTIPITAELKTAIDIFYMVNASGVSLTEAELALAQISGYWPEARETFKQKLEELKSGWFGFDLDFVVYCLLAILHRSWTEMKKLHEEGNRGRMIEVWNRLDRSTLNYVVNLLQSRAYVDHIKEINSPYALVPIIVYIFDRQEKLSETEIRKIIKWFYYSQIRYRYISQLQQKLNTDIGIVTSAESPFDTLVSNLAAERPLEIFPEEFEGARIQNPLYALMRWYFKSRNARCLTTGIGIRKNMGEVYALEWDHIFSYSLLTKNGYPDRLSQEITNRAVLTMVANRTKSDRTAEEYLWDVKKNFPDALSLQSIPENPELWKIENFEKFLGTRRKMLAEELNAFLVGIMETSKVINEANIETMIVQGESDQLEFKSSLSWSYRGNQIDKRLESVVLKTIAAFANADGGKLIIGVDDEGTVLGLERDYVTLRGSKDEFELHLRNLVQSAIWANGKIFAASNLFIRFHNVNDLEICEVMITKSNQPIYLQITENGDKKMEKFYVRSGNSSQELSPSEAHKYAETHFK